ncbi:hypothetical protein [Paenibacillus graminis]|uniref:hypothetical protein n=1 Tax=Paenibacillus graminis TaxID=189425 RepID=UPI000A8D64F4|nr:hypothetical protein [Paenibacillus graminis]
MLRNSGRNAVVEARTASVLRNSGRNAVVEARTASVLRNNGRNAVVGGGRYFRASSL